MSVPNRNGVKKTYRKKTKNKVQGRLLFLHCYSAMEKQANAALNEASTSTGAVAVPENYSTDFYSTGRIGRRNALPDILSYNCAATSTADLADRMSTMSTDEASNAASNFNSSAASSSVPSTSSYKENNINLT